MNIFTESQMDLVDGSFAKRHLVDVINNKRLTEETLNLAIHIISGFNSIVNIVVVLVSSKSQVSLEAITLEIVLDIGLLQG